MQFTNTKFNGAVVDLTLLTEIMEGERFCTCWTVGLSTSYIRL